AADRRPTLVTYDLPRWLGWWKRGQRGVHLYYLLWQWGAYRTARRLHRARPFDLVHHVTFVSIHQPSFMGLLGTRFWFGPLAGGDSVPRTLRPGLGLRAWAVEVARDLANGLARHGPLRALAFAQAERIIVTSEATRALLPESRRGGAEIELAIGLEEPLPEAATARADDGVFRVLMAGRLAPIKGTHLGLAAFAALVGGVPGRSDPSPYPLPPGEGGRKGSPLPLRKGKGEGWDRTAARLTIVGEGPAKGKLQARAAALGIAGRVTWVTEMPRAALRAWYAEHDVLLFTGLRDSGGMVVLEAMAAGVPVVCLDLGGPARIVDSGSGIVVATAGCDEAAVIDGLATALATLAGSADLRHRLGLGAAARARAFTFANLARRLYADVAVDDGPGR
ncbi:MAG: glycosyltransferase family 4 protein, partial [Acidimicrobiales bacterium]